MATTWQTSVGRIVLIIAFLHHRLVGIIGGAPRRMVVTDKDFLSCRWEERLPIMVFLSVSILWFLVRRSTDYTELFLMKMILMSAMSNQMKDKGHHHASAILPYQRAADAPSCARYEAKLADDAKHG